MTAIEALHFKKLLIIVRFGYTSVSEIFLIILIDISYICCFHAFINTPLLIAYKTIYVFLQSLHKHSNVVTITHSVMHLNGERKKTLSVALEILAHGEYGKKKFTFVIDVDVHRGKFKPRNHRDIEGVGRCAVLRRIARGLGILLRIRFIVL